VYKRKPQNDVSNGVLHAELQLPEQVGDLLVGGGPRDLCDVTCRIENRILLVDFVAWTIEFHGLLDSMPVARCRPT
jgi:hypothetical protein